MTNAIATDHGDRIQPFALYDRATGLPLVATGGLYVQGPAADGAAPVGNPEVVAGVDSTPLVRRLSVIPDNAAAGATPNALLTGAKYFNGDQAYANGDAAVLQANAMGLLGVWAGSGTAGDGLSAGLAAFQDRSAAARPLQTVAYEFNSASYDRPRSVAGGLATGLGTKAVHNVPTSVAPAAIAPVVTGAVDDDLVLKASPGNLYGLQVLAGAVPGFVLLIDATAAPADGAVTPKKCWPLAANAALTLAFSPPLRFGTGIVAVFSTTGPFVKTASATAFMSGEAV